MTRLFLKIAGLMVVVNLALYLCGMGLRFWLEKEQIIITPQLAPQVLSQRVVDAWENDELEEYSAMLTERGTAVALFNEDNIVLYADKDLMRLIKRNNRRRFNQQDKPRKNRGEKLSQQSNSTIRRTRLKPPYAGVQFTQDVTNSAGEVYTVMVRSKKPLHQLLPQPQVKRYAYILITLLTLLVSSLIISYYITRPIRSLRRTTQSLGERDLSARVDEDVADREDAIGELGRDFNRMAQRLDDTSRSQHQLLRDVSHELRSPLARIQMANMLAEQKTGASSELSRIDKETLRLDSLIETILRLTRLNDLPELNFSPVDLNELIVEITNNAKYEYQDTEKKIAIHMDENLSLVNADQENLASALENILRNAMYYTADPSTVTITAKQVNNAIELEIADEGPGVPETDLKRLFEPFFRSDTSRNEKTGSNGVGLAITHRIIELHQGSVWATNRPEGGLSVSVRLPL
ncbi:HAMP domain-containing protein [Leucothrix sargassi]|nr:HAMP domain-containing protein [Leucothrix sargassi]